MNLCFVGLKCYDLLVGSETPRYIGGIERQFVSLATGMANRGHNVSFVTYDHGQGIHENQDGIKIVPAFGPNDGLPGLRFLFPRMSGILRAIRQTSGEMILQMGASTETFASSLACRLPSRRKRSFIFFVASDSDCLTDTPLIPHRRERIVYKRGLLNSRIVIVQSDRQRQLMANSFGIDAEVAVMPAGSLGESAVEPNVGTKRERRVLWIGRISPEKRPELLLEIAKQCPDIRFDIVGAANESSQFSLNILEAAREIANVRAHGKVSDTKLRDLFARSSVLCCTSIIEGFPTTFLEAWSNGVPVVTTFDPDGIIERNALGVVSSDISEIGQSIHRLTENEPLWQEYSERCVSYFEKTHSEYAAVERIENLLVRK